MTIYVLIDPRDGAVRYVGKTARALAQRLREHVAERGASHRARWLQLLVKLGLRPDIEVIEEVDGDGCEAERRYIAEYRAEGHDLVNGTDGGEGVWKPTPEVRAKQGAGMRGKKHSPETLAKISAANRGRRMDPAHKERLLAIHTGRKHTDETRAKIAAWWAS